MIGDTYPRGGNAASPGGPGMSQSTDGGAKNGAASEGHSTRSGIDTGGAAARPDRLILGEDKGDDRWRGRPAPCAGRRRWLPQAVQSGPRRGSRPRASSSAGFRTSMILDQEALEIIETNAETVLEEIGVSFIENPKRAGALARRPGADVRGDRVHIPRGPGTPALLDGAGQVHAACAQPREVGRDWRQIPSSCTGLRPAVSCVI